MEIYYSYMIKGKYITDIDTNFRKKQVMILLSNNVTGRETLNGDYF